MLSASAQGDGEGQRLKCHNLPPRAVRAQVREEIRRRIALKKQLTRDRLAAKYRKKHRNAAPPKAERKKKVEAPEVDPEGNAMREKVLFTKKVMRR